MAFVELLETFDQALVTSFITKLAPVIKNRLRKRVPDLIAHRLTRKLACGFFDVAPEIVVTFVASSESYDDYAGWQFAVGRQVIQCRDKFAMCEITRSTEDHDAAWLWHGPRRPSFSERVWFGLIRCAIHSVRRLRDFRRLNNTNCRRGL